MWGLHVSLPVPLPEHSPTFTLLRVPGGSLVTPYLCLECDRRAVGLEGGGPPLQFLMIFFSKGLQGERGLTGLTGDKGEPVRRGGRGW
jgi:hypothetical protein